MSQTNGYNHHCLSFRFVQMLSRQRKCFLKDQSLKAPVPKREGSTMNTVDWMHGNPFWHLHFGQSQHTNPNASRCHQIQKAIQSSFLHLHCDFRNVLFMWWMESCTCWRPTCAWRCASFTWYQNIEFFVHTRQGRWSWYCFNACWHFNWNLDLRFSSFLSKNDYLVGWLHIHAEVAIFCIQTLKRKMNGWTL